MTERTRVPRTFPWFGGHPKGDQIRPADAELEALIKPYSEVIVGTRTPPEGASQIEVEVWGDLVKTSDTLGKPILRCGSAGDQPGRLFYVRDGSVDYVYLYRATEAPGLPSESLAGAPPVAGAGTEPLSPGANGTAAEANPAAVPAEPEPGTPSPGDGRHPLPSPEDSMQRTTEKARELLTKLKTIPPSSPEAREATPHIQAALQLLSRGDSPAAKVQLDEAERWLHRR